MGISDEHATNNIQKFNRFSSDLDISGNQSFSFQSQALLNPKIIKQFVKDNSISTRIIYNLLNLFK